MQLKGHWVWGKTGACRSYGERKIGKQEHAERTLVDAEKAYATIQPASDIYQEGLKDGKVVYQRHHGREWGMYSAGSSGWSALP